MNNSYMQFMRQNCFDASMPEHPLLQRGNALTIPVLCLALQVAMGQSLALAWYAWEKDPQMNNSCSAQNIWQPAISFNRNLGVD